MTLDQDDINAIIAAIFGTSVPGNFPSGTAGNVLGRISASNVSIVAPIDNQQNITLNLNTDYNADYGWAIDFTSTSWPSLTSAEIFMVISGHSTVIDGEAVNATKARIEFDKEDLQAIGEGKRKYELYAILDGVDEFQTLLAEGTLLIKGLVIPSVP